MRRRDNLRSAIGVSWKIFSQGGLWITGLMGWALAQGLIWIDGLVVHQKPVPLQLNLALLALGFGFSVFVSLTPFWMTLLSFCIPKRSTP